MLLVSGATKVMATIEHPSLGTLLVPGNGNKPAGKPWACDNGAFSGFREKAFLKMLGKVRGLPGCLWVAAPDVVCNCPATLALFDKWEPTIREMGFPVALVAQNGLTIAATPWARLDCLFIGGDDAFKLGAETRSLVTEAKRRGKLVHMGRVNSLRRIRYAYEIGVDSVDGSSFSKFSKRWIRWGLDGMKAITSQGLLSFESPEPAPGGEGKP
jgi:hypothetical protein